MSGIDGAGLYIGLTGLDGAGKSTQASYIGNYLRTRGRQCYICEPKDDLVPQATMTIAARHRQNARGYYGTFAFELAKAFGAVRHHFSLVAPLLAAGIDVVDPRTNNCRLALAAAHKCDSLEKLEEVYKLTRNYDVLFFVDVSPDTAFSRVNKRGTDVENLTDLINFYSALKTTTPETACRIDGETSALAAFKEVQIILDQLVVRTTSEQMGREQIG